MKASEPSNPKGVDVEGPGWNTATVLVASGAAVVSDSFSGPESEGPPM